MTHLSKRTLLSIAGWSTIAATAALVGCGKKADEAAPAAAPAEPASAAA